MGIDLKSENLTISVPNMGCNKNCPYCISKMTGFIESDGSLFYKNINKALTVSKQAEITSVLITGKGEPTMDLGLLYTIIEFIDKKYYLPIELQTNGILLKNNKHIVPTLKDCGLDVIAISIDNKFQLDRYGDLFDYIKQLNLVLRVTVNITNMLDLSFDQLLEYCILKNIDQLTIRRIVPPEDPKASQVVNWIKENAPVTLYDDMVKEAKEVINKNGKLIRQLSHGANIYDLSGVAFTHSDYCIQEFNMGSNIRSLIYQENGHLYTSWNSKASILF